MDISISDVRLFNRCRRKWDLTSPNRQGLGNTLANPKYFLFGSAVHRVLDIMACNEYTPETIEQVFNEYFLDDQQQMTLEDLDEARQLMTTMLEGYIDHYQPILGTQFEYLASEQTFRVPIPNTDGHLRGTVDGLALNKHTGDIWVLEHKTFSRKPSFGTIMLDEQLRTYAWAIPQVTDAPRVGGVLYDGLWKKEPTIPTMLKNGKMSTRKLDTTRKVYTEELLRNGLDPKDLSLIHI